MKKMIFLLFIFLLLPLNIFAYSKKVIPGGDSIGIELHSDGLIVVGFYKVNNKYIAKDNIKIGDRIIKINNIDVSSIEELSKAIDESILKNKNVSVELIRNNKLINTYLKLEKDNNLYKTGLYIKDDIIGIGSLTYIDPITKIYGALGHAIILDETNKNVEIKDGNILMSKVTSINKSVSGRVGSKNASINYNQILGNINKNTSVGIYGNYTYKLPKRNTLEIASFNDITLSNAYILTSINNNEIEKYEINIIDKYNNKRNTNKAFGFEVVDKKLLKETGGIVQGMSGSPIIQNNKIIGAVTNVLVDEPYLGYGISIVTMLEEGEK